MRLLTFQDFNFDKWYKEWYCHCANDIVISFQVHESIMSGYYNSSSSPIFCYMYTIGFLVKEEDTHRGLELFRVTPEGLIIQNNCTFQFSVILPEVAKLIIISGSIDGNVIDLNTIEIILLLDLAHEYFQLVLDKWFDDSIPIPILDS